MSGGAARLHFSRAETSIGRRSCAMSREIHGAMLCNDWRQCADFAESAF
jgi:hypothetical protein